MSELARRAARRAAARGGYMASLLQAYQTRRHMTDHQLADFVGCAPDRLPLLGLCAQPRDDAGLFSADVRRIAAYAHADPGQLAQLIRAVHVDEALATTHLREGEEGYLAAARDREDAPDARPGDDTAAPELGPEADGDLG